MKNLHSYLILITLVFITLNTHAKKFPVKFGKVSDKEVKKKSCEADTSAVAVILCDYGHSKFMYTDHSGFNIQFSRLIRIKILKKEGYKWAKREIFLRSRTEKLTKLRANTYTEENGKVKKIKLERNQIFNEEINKYWDVTKLEMPMVKEGSVVEIEYTINADSYHIRDWFFQSEIPTMVSQYIVEIPEFFHYKQLQKGYLPITFRDMEVKNDFITITQKTRDNSRNATSTSYNNQKFDFRTNYYTFRSENVPALYEESYSTCIENYLSAIEFELGTTKFPNAPVKNYTTTWEAIGKDLMKDEDFGFQLSYALFLNKTAKEIQKKFSNENDRINAAYSFVKNHVTWNKIHTIYSFDGLKHAYNKREGNVADINLMLTALLQKMELDAHPVILSTRENGFVHPAQIMIDQFNYVITAVKTENGTVLLDATEKYITPGVLPQRCLNDKGRLINKSGGDWINLNASVSNKKTIQVNYTLSADGSLSGKATERYEDYAALNIRKSLNYFNNEEEYIEDYQEKFPELEITLDSVSHRDNLWEPISFSYMFESQSAVEQMGNLLLINPGFLIQIKNNPFKLEKRIYPVDYSYPYNTTYMATINIPDGYQVEELPKPQRIMLPEESASFNYSIRNLNNQLVVVAKFDINKTVFLPEEYDFLKQFYNLIIDAEAKKIVLKKI